MLPVQLVNLAGPLGCPRRARWSIRQPCVVPSKWLCTHCVVAHAGPHCGWLPRPLLAVAKSHARPPSHRVPHVVGFDAAGRFFG